MNILVLLRLGNNENEDDLNPLRVALNLKKSGDKIYCISMCSETYKESFKICFDYRADYVYILSDPKFAGADTYLTSQILTLGIQYLKVHFDVILTSSTSRFGETSHVPAAISARLKLPYVVNVIRMVCDNERKNFICYQNFGEYCETVEVNGECLIMLAYKLDSDWKIRRDPTLFDIVGSGGEIKVLNAYDIGFDNLESSHRRSYTLVLNSKKLERNGIEHIKIKDIAEADNILYGIVKQHT